MGTRPEAIKLAPVILELNKYPKDFQTQVVITGQHRQMLDQILKDFDIPIDSDLNIMTHNQPLDQILSRAHLGVGEVLEAKKPDLAVVQGDTTTTMAAAVAAYHHQIPLAHVEAGLRSFDKYNPFPEEVNRAITDTITDFAFAPTQLSRNNLIKAGVEEEKIYVTGNTVVDALQMISSLDYPFEEKQLKTVDFLKKRVILLTTHRRENYLTGEMSHIFQAVNELVSNFDDILVIFPVHLNPNVRKVVADELELGSQQVVLTEPLGYKDLVKLMKASYLVLTDSGGIQEEAPSLGKPVLVLRKVTERPEGVSSGAARLVGTDKAMIIEAATQLLTDQKSYEKMAQARGTYGDGHASQKIVTILKEKL